MKQGSRELSAHLFGPVPSRRLGLSLGIDIIPYKTCTLDCVYCELGSTGRTTLRRKKYVAKEVILKEVREFLKSRPSVDFLTFSGSGEPTLNSDLGAMIAAVKKMTAVPVAVITNGTLLWLLSVRRALAKADVVLPSLDTATWKTFLRLNRPHPGLKLGRIIKGLKLFRKKYQGQIWLEILLVGGLNDRQSELVKLARVVRKIGPDRIHLNTVDRPPAEKAVRVLTYGKMLRIKRLFGSNCEIIASFSGRGEVKAGSGLNQPERGRICALVKRRPVTRDEIAQVLGLPVAGVAAALAELLKKKKIILKKHLGKKYYCPVS